MPSAVIIIADPLVAMRTSDKLLSSWLLLLSSSFFLSNLLSLLLGQIFFKRDLSEPNHGILQLALTFIDAGKLHYVNIYVFLSNVMSIEAFLMNCGFLLESESFLIAHAERLSVIFGIFISFRGSRGLGHLLLNLRHLLHPFLFLFCSFSSMHELLEILFRWSGVCPSKSY